MITAKRYHDISCGHVVSGHEGKCAHLHGHNYRIHFTVAAISGFIYGQKKADHQLDDVGRILDFSVIKEKLCMWLENHWDHKFLVWQDDPRAKMLAEIDPTVVWTRFNPTAENMAYELLNTIGPEQLSGTGCMLIEVLVSETAKCSALACRPVVGI